MDDEEAARFGAECAAVFNSGPVRKYLDHVERQMMDAVKACNSKDDAGRYRLVAALQSIEKFWEFLDVSAANGELSAKLIEEVQSGRKPFF